MALVTGYKDQGVRYRPELLDRPLVGGEKGWRKALHDGLVRTGGGTQAGAATAGTTTALRSLRASLPRSSKRLRSVFMPSWIVFDGRFTNNGWLQEAPDPITKFTWDNAALLSPATAKKLGVEHGDMSSRSNGGGARWRPRW